MRRRPLSCICLLAIFLIYLGSRLTSVSSSAFSGWEGKQVSVTGKVYRKEWTSQAEKERKVLYLHLISAEGELHYADIESHYGQQNVICYLKPDQELPEMGSVISVEGKLKNFEKPSNPGQFDAESYYHILKISFQLNQTEIQTKSDTYSRIGEALYQAREYFSGILDSSLSKTDASIMKTMLLGEKGAADGEIKSLYQRNGIAHILAISGLHISLLGMTLYKILKRAGLPVWVSAGLSAFMVVLYGFMTGFSVSSLRAMIMFSLHMAALLFGRTYDMVTAAFLAAVLLLADQPLYLYSSSFWFSFGCIFAIGFLAPALTKEGKQGKKQPGKIQETFLSGAALTMAGIPLQLCFFYYFPLYAAALNLLVIPLMSFLVLGGILLLFFYKAALFNMVLSSLITGILAVYEEACRLTEALPYHILMPGKPGVIQTGMYLLVLFLVIALKDKLSLQKKWVIVLCGAFLLFLPGKKELTVTFLDVGQGDCIHVKTMEGNHYLIDGGSTSVSQAGTYRIIPYLKTEGAAVIEALFITHPDEDHYNGVVELMKEGKVQGISIKHLYLPDVGENSRTEAYERLVAEAETAGIPVGYISKGQALLEEGFTLLCLHPEKGYENSEPNAFSTVLLLSFGNFNVLLTGDVEKEGEELLMQSLQETEEGEFDGFSFREGSLTVLKAAHHGSSGTTSEEILRFLNPVYTVISCGKNNSYGHPHAELLERLEEQGTEIMITYETGAVTFHTDGKELWVEKFLEE